ncbi:PLP-dependent transferase [Lojkania enalia]|uniref:PLP-dependent transferase n=1 Tax=Lojkania enalia TaxID=147567 RepID=A0A9P4JXT8_9PLEO|nr:PLP-dependent transferase [Didymosphaeria enalia]
MTRVASGLWKNLIALQVYGANTSVGKTIVSTLLGRHLVRRTEKDKTQWAVRYIKPVSTGPADEADESYVRRYAGYPTTTLFKYSDPVSPHVAARGSFIPSDDVLVSNIAETLQEYARYILTSKGQRGLSIVETAGGVLSPGPSGTPQADLFRPLRLPVLLVGDHRLGGISSTISACESLLVRGYDVDAVVCFNDGSKLGNSEYLSEHFGKLGISTFELPWIPDVERCSKDEETEKMQEYYASKSKSAHVEELAHQIINQHSSRLTNLSTMASRTQKSIWHPFTQHKSISAPSDILVFDSAYGDYFQTLHTPKSLSIPSKTKPTLQSHILERSPGPVLFPAFDGSASWWTQGLGHGNSTLSLAAAYAAGRYGHVMFAGATHEPAITLAERLLNGLKNPRLTKVFYTDNGSTAIEVGIKMALRAACKKYGWGGSSEEIGIIGLKGSYHGDTIGAMDASEPSVYNKKVDWYRGRGHWFDVPEVKLRRGKWVVEPPAGMEEDFGPTQEFDELDDIFDFDARGQAEYYAGHIKRILDELVKRQGKRFGALIMEPVIMGAGGMIFVDPLFQRALTTVIREYDFGTNPSSASAMYPPGHNAWTGLPVLFDEVFTGLYRLGRFTSSSFLDILPDISVHAKLLTGGLIPLSATVASQGIFEAFWGDEKSDALLHGHSYTAHALGCHVANTSLDEMNKLQSSDLWKTYRQSWTQEQQKEPNGGLAVITGKEQGVWSMWNKETVMELSRHKRVDYAVALGSVLAVSLIDELGSGYTSNAAASLRDSMMYDLSNSTLSVHSRVLGNVIYLMASMNTKAEHLAAVEKVLLSKLG